jgi:hypothetical protein
VTAVDDLEVVESFVRHVRNLAPTDGERVALTEAIDEAMRRRVEV